MTIYIWQKDHWQDLLLAEPADDLLQLENDVRTEAGMLASFVQALSSGSRRATHAALIADEATDSNAIEGVRLSRDSFYASALRRLGAVPGGQIDRRNLPVIEALLDATENAATPLTAKTLHRWQEAVLAYQTSSFVPALTGMYRASAEDMQIVSRNAAGREKVHYTAPPADRVPAEMKRLIDWVRSSPEAKTFRGAALAHLWFEIIHPYEDGNGRVGRLLWDRLIAGASAESTGLMGRWWAVSHHIVHDVAPYYDVLNAVSTGREQPEAFVRWGLQATIEAFKRTRQVARDVVRAEEIMAHSATAGLNHRQVEVLSLMVKHGSEGFAQGMSVRKYRSLTEASEATASRDLAGLVAAGFLAPRGQGRSRVYDVVWDLTG